MKNYTIFINTCDKFQDCWEPFFKLFSIYWPNYKGKIYLNTEYKEFNYNKLNIISIKGCAGKQDAHKITWSECLFRALNTIEEDIILYLQEDYFFKDFVKNDIIEKYANLMNDNFDIDCIHLTDQAVASNDIVTKFDGLKNVLLKQRYRISCQAALWRKETLLSYVRTHESAWQFEEFGSQRSSLKSHNFFVVDPKWVELDRYEIIPYIFTGIVQGRWYEKVVPLFVKHEIVVDFSKRGFVQDAKPKPIFKKILFQLNRIPALITHKIEMLKTYKLKDKF